MYRIMAIICFILLLTACTKNSSVSDPTNANESPARIVNEIVDEDNEVDEQGPVEKKNLFSPIATYKDTEVLTIDLNDSTLQTSFSKHRFEPFGFYIPDSMEVKQYEDGVDWIITDSTAKISVGWYDNIVENLTATNDVLTQYNEYIASEKNHDTNIDYFIFEQNEIKYQIMVFYNEDEKGKFLPLLLKVIETIRYVE